MIKYIISVFLLLSITNPISVFSDFWNQKWEKPFIIPRASWWANSQFNNLGWIYWTDILEKRKNYTPPTQSEENIAYQKQKTKDIEDYLYWNFINQFTSQETIKQSDNITYAWPLKYTNYVDSIIVHHTHSEYDDTIFGLNNIHKYHSLSRQWWDIGYNYIIWYDWKIYEGREGWDYIVGAHSKYNNFATVWIAIMWNYETVWIDEKQYQSLESLIQYLIVRYGIDLNKKRYYHRTCIGVKCDTFHIETYLDSTLIWHRDATHTSCPWEKLYEQIQEIRTNNLEFSRGKIPVLRNSNQQLETATTETSTSQIQKILKLLRNYSPEQKQNIITLIDIKKAETDDADTKRNLQTIRLAVLLSLK